MEMYLEKSPTYISAAKLILAVAGPAQRLVHKPAMTHIFCIHQANTILQKDGHVEFSEILERYLPDLDKGVVWADKGFKNLSHFFNPISFKGLPTWTNAISECNLYWNQSITNWRNRNYEKAFFYLGAALHLVQDLCEPHHAMGILLDGHKTYEDWVEAKRENYSVELGGIYGLGKSPSDWIKSNATLAIRNYHLVRANSSDKNFHQATSILLPRTQQVTAGFLHHYLNKMLSPMINQSIKIG